MLSGVPEPRDRLGYTNASWTLKCDLTCEYVCRLLNHMDEHGYRQATPRNCDPRSADAAVPRPHVGLRPALARPVPEAGVEAPWRLYQNYARDILTLRCGAIEDGALEFSNPAPVSQPAEPLAA